MDGSAYRIDIDSILHVLSYQRLLTTPKHASPSAVGVALTFRDYRRAFRLPGARCLSSAM